MAIQNEPELPDDIYAQIRKHSFVGDELAEKGHFEAAIGRYNKAWDLLPAPKSRWKASTWLLIAIADAAFLGKDFSLAREVLDDLKRMEDAVGNPFILMRNGQVLFEEGKLDEAANEMMLAYMSEGKEIFDRDDPKYYEFLKTRARDLE
ncbi:hypothetical protein [Parerythrobacter aestuarii]|uniref:hypothetical protein n=1 Tax=Parerythrobacter aestuarii TaxID=3020909 RepID=UPI0024DEF712|nr:hypothetical protein [Parerythrobacter aestuarii]